MEVIRNFWQDESGASSVEYGLLVTLIAASIIGVVSSLGQAMNNIFQSQSSTFHGNVHSSLR
jgi:pilus assembly protein Flp/PilA